MGFLSSFRSLGLDDLEDADLFEEKKEREAQKAEPPKEEDFLLEKMVKCPVCDRISPQKIMKTGKVKLIETDVDLRPKYEHLDFAKYEVYQCEYCGYAALAKNFSHLTPKQIQLVNETVCSRVILNDYEGPTYSYEQAVERYKLALACAVAKKAKTSEKAYICLKTAWLMRGFAEHAEAEMEEDLLREIREAEMGYLEKAFQGFSKAVTEESFPICSMDELTLDYLLAAIAFQIKRTDASSRLVSKILQSPNANSRAKDKARALKDQILEEIRKNKNQQPE